METPTTMI
jgi:hypothetical protein